MSRVTNDVDNLTELITSGVVSALAETLTLVGIVAFMLYLNLYLSLIAFNIIPFMVLFAGRRLGRDENMALRLSGDKTFKMLKFLLLYS